MAAVAGLRGTGDWGTDERPKNFRESILFYEPDGTAPIFGLTSKAGKKTVDDPEFSWWIEGNVLIRLTVNGALAAGDTTVVVDSSDPSTSTPDVNYGLATHLKPGDLLLVEKTDQASYDNEIIEVTSVQSATTFTANRGAAGTTAATIADNALLTVIGSSYAEGTAAPTAVSRNPLKYSNYTQIFKDTYELTGTADATRARTGSAWSNDKKRKMFKHAADIEFSMLFGVSDESTGSNGKPKRTMGGLRNKIPSANVTVFSSAVTVSSFYDALAPMFQFGSSSDTRIMFAGYTALLELNKVFQANSNTNMNFSGPKIEMYGMNFTEMILPHGRVLIKSHPLLSQHPRYKSSAFVVEFNDLKYVSLKGRDTKVKDDVQAKDEDVRRGYIQTECSMMLDLGGLNCGYLGTISAT